MNKVTIVKADPITDHKPIENAVIYISAKIPNHANLKAASDFYDLQTAGLFEVLKKHLPQAIMHRLLILLLKDKECLLRIE